jgi:hypothetical protein
MFHVHEPHRKANSLGTHPAADQCLKQSFRVSLLHGKWSSEVLTGLVMWGHACPRGCCPAATLILSQPTSCPACFSPTILLFPYSLYYCRLSLATQVCPLLIPACQPNLSCLFQRQYNCVTGNSYLRRKLQTVIDHCLPQTKANNSRNFTLLIVLQQEVMQDMLFIPDGRLRQGSVKFYG